MNTENKSSKVYGVSYYSTVLNTWYTIQVEWHDELKGWKYWLLINGSVVDTGVSTYAPRGNEQPPAVREFINKALHGLTVPLLELAAAEHWNTLPSAASDTARSTPAAGSVEPPLTPSLLAELEKLKAELNCPLSANDMLKEMDWSNVLWDHKLSEELIEYLRNQIDWKLLCKQQRLSAQFIKKHWVKLGGAESILYWQWLSPEDINAYVRMTPESDVLWNTLVCRQTLSNEFLVEHAAKLDWLLVSQFQQASEEVLMQFEGLIDPELVVTYNRQIGPTYRHKLLKRCARENSRD